MTNTIPKLVGIIGVLGATVASPAPRPRLKAAILGLE